MSERLKKRRKERERKPEKKPEKKPDKKPKNIKYGQANFKPSLLGLKSCVFAFLSIGILTWTLGSAFMAEGVPSNLAGGFGVIAIIFAGMGIQAGIQGLKEKDRRKWSSKVGITFCVLILLVLVFIFLGGL